MQRPKKDLPRFSYPLEELVSTSSIIFYQCNMKDGYPLIYMSDNVKDILGYTSSEFFDSDSLWTDRIHPEDKDKVLKRFDHIRDLGSFVLEFRFRHKEGHYLWLRDEAKLIEDDTGRPKSIVGSSIDITSEKKAELELKELNETLEGRIRERTEDLSQANRKLSSQQQKLRVLEMALANINDMVVISRAPMDDPLNSQIVFVNEAFKNFTGYSYEDVQYKNPALLHGEETSKDTLREIEERIKNHRHLRVELVSYKKDGTSYWVELDMSPFPAEDPDYEYWVGINRDITQRKEAELSLEESEYRHRAYSELSFDAIFEISLEGIIIDCNTRASEMFGYGHEEMIGSNIDLLIPEEYKSFQPDHFTREVTTGKEAWERLYRHKDGSLIPTQVTTRMYTMSEEDRLIAYVRDISEQKEYEQTIKESLREKETLLSEIHHRVKNNLAIISGLLDMQSFNAESDELVEELSESQSRIQSIAMVHEKLYQSESLSVISIDSYIDELLNFITGIFGSEEQEIEVRKEIEAVTLDIGQAIPCGLVLNELITNAYKHAFRGRDSGVLSISLEIKEGTVALSVEDDGVGLPEDFNEQETSSLGWTLIQTLISQLEGTLEVSSDNGTRFEITFPKKAGH